MLVVNAIKKLEKVSSRVTTTGRQITAEVNNYLVELTTQDNEVSVIRVRRATDIDDPMSDYSAGSFFDNLNQVLRFVEGR